MLPEIREWVLMEGPFVPVPLHVIGRRGTRQLDSFSLEPLAALAPFHGLNHRTIREFVPAIRHAGYLGPILVSFQAR